MQAIRAAEGALGYPSQQVVRTGYLIALAGAVTAVIGLVAVFIVLALLGTLFNRMTSPPSNPSSQPAARAPATTECQRNIDQFAVPTPDSLNTSAGRAGRLPPAQHHTNVSGKWHGIYITRGKSVPFEAEFQQQGSRLIGLMRDYYAVCIADIQGDVEGNNIRFVVRFRNPRSSLVSHVGQVHAAAAAAKASGTWSSEVKSGEWQMQKQSELAGQGE